MKVMLIQPVEGLGNTGDTVQVKDGYARNYLIPNKLALPGSAATTKVIQHRNRVVEARVVQERKRAQDLVEKLETTSFTMERHVGEEEKLFGSVSNRDIAACLQAEGLNIHHGQILLEENIKKLGVYSVPVKLHADLETTVKVWVVAK